jgi:hypothetical protein
MHGRKGGCAASAITMRLRGHRDGEWAERGEVTLEARRENRRGMQYDGPAHASPWPPQGSAGLPRCYLVIKTADLTGFTGGPRSDPPLTPNPDQCAFDFQ